MVTVINFGCFKHHHSIWIEDNFSYSTASPQSQHHPHSLSTATLDIRVHSQDVVPKLHSPATEVTQIHLSTHMPEGKKAERQSNQK